MVEGTRRRVDANHPGPSYPSSGERKPSTKRKNVEIAARSDLDIVISDGLRPVSPHPRQADG